MPLPLDRERRGRGRRRGAADRRPGHAGLPARVSPTPSISARSGSTGPACRSSTPCGPCGTGVDLGGVDEALQRGETSAAWIAAGPIAHAEAPRLGLDAGFCRRYLPNILHFDLGPREQAGLHHYYMLACELGLARRGVNLEYYHPAASCRKPLTASA